VLKKRDINQILILGHANLRTEIPDCLGCVASPSHAGDGWHPRIIPSLHIFSFHEFDQPPLAENRVAEVEAGEFDLLRMAFRF